MIEQSAKGVLALRQGLRKWIEGKPHLHTSSVEPHGWYFAAKRM